MKKDKLHLLHYLALTVLLGAGFVLFYLANGFPGRQLFISSLIAFLYVFWGIVHHSLKGDLHPRIVIEYSLIAILSVILVRGVLLR